MAGRFARMNTDIKVNFLGSRLRGNDETGIPQIMKNYRYQLGRKKITARLTGCGILLLAMLFASAAFGDEIDDRLPPDAPQAVKASARQAIQSGLDQDSVARLTRAMLQHQFDGQQIRHCHNLMIQAHNGGMPVEPLMNKAYEGMAKGVGPSLIVGAMERVQARNSFAYRHAAQLSGNKAQEASLGDALSAAMAAGFLNADADRVTPMIRQRAQTMQPDEAYNLALECFYTARDVSRLGVSSGAVANMLGGALENGFGHQKMRTMRYAFMHQARQSEPKKLAHKFAESIRAGKGFQNGPGPGPGSDGEGTGGPGPGRDGSGSSGGSSGGGSAGSGKGSGSGGSGSGGSGPGHGKQ